MFTFEQLRGFVAVSEELHFGRAAARLNMTQPPLSRQIQKLERSVGVRLLERDKRRVALTAAGEAFLDEARRLLALADTAPALARRISQGSVGTIRIGFTAASTYGTLTRILDTISASLPEVSIDLYEMVTREQVDALDHGELDLGLARPPFDPEAYASHPIARENLVLAVPEDHRLSQATEPVSADDLAREPIIMHSPTKARYFYDLVVRHLQVPHQNVTHTVSQILTMLWLVAGRRGLAFVPESAQHLHIDGVRFLPLAGLPPEPVELHLLWRRDARNPVLGHVIDSLRILQH